MTELLVYLVYVGVALGGVALLLSGTRNVRAGVLILAVMIMSSAISPQMAERGYYGRTWLFAAQSLRAELYLASACLLSLIIAVHGNKVQFSRVSVVSYLMLCVNIYAGILDARWTPQEGMFRVGLSIVTIGSAAIYVTAMLRTWDDYLALLRALGLVGLLWIGGSMVQAVLDKSQMLVDYGRRFVGLLGNPQGTAVYLGPQSAILLWLFLNDPLRRMRWLWGGAFATVLMMVAWTGSRTGALLTMVGIVFLLRARFGRAVFALPLLVLGLIGVAYLVQAIGIELPFDRLLGGADTRSLAWTTLLEDALNAGLFGEGWQGARFVENAFLLGWVAYGPIMLAILLAIVASLVVLNVRLWRIRGEVADSVRSLIDLIAAYSVMFFIGGQFEWFIISRVDSNIQFVVIFTTMGASILASVKQSRESAEELPTEEVAEASEYGEGYEDSAQRQTQ